MNNDVVCPSVQLVFKSTQAATYKFVKQTLMLPCAFSAWQATELMPIARQSLPECGALHFMSLSQLIGFDAGLIL